jgi:predicted methyltransferase MtxX (methanogen marker protein 4)
MIDYTQREKRVLLAGLVGGRERDYVWGRFPEAIANLSDRGLVRLCREVFANGTESTFPLCLSPVGVLEARKLQEIGQLSSLL